MPTALLAFPQLCDALALAIVLLFALVGAGRGALRGVLRIVGLLAAAAVGRFAAPLLAPALQSAFGVEAEAARAASWVAVGLAVAAALGICFLHLNPWIDRARIPLFDPLLGLALGLAFGAAVVATGVLCALTVARAESPLARGVGSSRSAHWTRRAAAEVAPVLQKVGI